MLKKLFGKLFPLCAVTLLAVACNSGDGDNGTEPAAEDATGVWTGTITEDGVGTFDAVGLIIKGDLIFISFDANAIYEGNVSVSGDTLTGTTTNYEIGGSVFSTADLTGSVVGDSSITGTYNASNDSTGSFDFTYDPVTDRGSSLSTVDANWSATRSGVTTTLAIDGTGAISGSDTTGCVYNGQVAIVDSSINIYEVNISASSCGSYNGDYTGYAVVTDDVNKNDTLIYSVSNDNFILVGSLTRT